MPPLTITFDVYGTLVRWDEVLHETLAELLARRGQAAADVTLAANALEAESRRLQAVGAFRPFRDILRDSLRPALATAGLRVEAAEAAYLLEQLAHVPPFAEVPAVLAELAAAGHRLAPVSNTDDALLAGTLAGLGPVFATTVTAEQARAYKPNPGLFRLAQRKLGTEPAGHLHVAQGTFSDLAVCAALGLRCIWVNRGGQQLQEGLQPLAIIPDLIGLPELVASLGPVVA